MSKYLNMLLKSKDFENEILELIKSLSGKKVLIYGVGLAFKKFNEKYKLSENLNIIGYSDKKFETKRTKSFCGKPAIEPLNINNSEWDYIVVTNEKAEAIENFLTKALKIDSSKIIKIFKETFKDEIISYNYLEKLKFAKHLKFLKKKLKDKTVVIYGAGVFFEAINKYYDLSELNIVGISDLRYSSHKENETFLKYKVYSLEEVEKLEPDYVLIATKYYINILETLYKQFKNKKTKLKPLVGKPLLTLLREIWG